ncbi:UNVERIFIED_CONTAM: hypothetical protein Sindi_1815000 [Sesamum indicum]
MHSLGRIAMLLFAKRRGGMGFREMKEFGRAMLTKQGRQLLTRPDSVPTQLLKAKYFPCTSFLEAGMGSHPSLTWRSILGTMDLLVSRCRWRIRSRYSVRILASETNWFSCDFSSPRVGARIEGLNFDRCNYGMWRVSLV